MGSLAEAARAATRRPGKPCSVCRMIDEADADLRADLLEALADRRISSSALYDEIVSAGIDPPGYQQIGHHRRGVCSGKAS